MIVYNRINEEPKENLITDDKHSKDDIREDENDQASAVGNDLNSQLENDDEIDSLHLNTEQNVNTADEFRTEYLSVHFEESADESIVDETVYLVIEPAADTDNQQQMKVRSQHRPGPAPSGPHICENCGKSFPFKSRLKKHQDQESGLKPYKCPLKGCDSAFSLQHRLKEHLQKSHLKPASEVASIIGIYNGATKKAKETK